MTAAPRAGLAAEGEITVRPGWYHRLLTELPGLRRGPMGAFRPPAGAVPRHSAVLVLFGDGPDGPDVLLTERSATLRSHAGQVAFPGGRLDPEDDGPAAAALREAREETGLDPAGVEFGGFAPDLYLSVTNYLVTPVVAWWRDPSPVRAVDPEEVVRTVRVPLAELTDPGNRFLVTHPSGYVGPGFGVRGLFVWGFTAGVLDGLLTLAGLERPWDRERRRPVPARPTPQEVEAAQGVPDPPEDADRGRGGTVPVGTVPEDTGQDRRTPADGGPGGRGGR